jgi:prophage regulatory protein
VFFYAFLNPNILRRNSMADSVINTHDLSANNNNLNNPTSVGCVPQSGADTTRLVAVAPSALDKIQGIREPSRILRLSAVINRVGLRRASIYQKMNQGSFPKSISLGIRAVGWVESEIDAWVQMRIKGRR